MITYGVLLFIAGIAISYFGYKVRDKIKRYEFENRTSGGNIQFENYSDTKKHGAMGCLGKFLGLIGVLVFFTGVLILILNYVN